MDVNNFYFRDRECFSGGVFLYCGEGTGHAKPVEIPPNTL